LQLSSLDPENEGLPVNYANALVPNINAMSVADTMHMMINMEMKA
jgi:hypothetical protein